MARADLGYTENPPGSNMTKYGEAYDPKIQGQKEVWVPVRGYETRYEVSNMGRVRNHDGHILKPIERRGYLCLNFCVNGVRKDVKIHRLVAEAFIPNPEELPFINHMDEDKHNNCADNLEWCTTQYNNNYGTRNARAREKRIGTKLNWTKEGLERLRAIHSAPIIGVHKKTGNTLRFPSATVAAQNGYNRHCLYAVINGRAKSHRGYIWYKEKDYELASGY